MCVCVCVCKGHDYSILKVEVLLGQAHCKVLKQKVDMYTVVQIYPRDRIDHWEDLCDDGIKKLSSNLNLEERQKQKWNGNTLGPEMWKIS